MALVRGSTLTVSSSWSLCSSSIRKSRERSCTLISGYSIPTFLYTSTLHLFRALGGMQAQSAHPGQQQRGAVLPGANLRAPRGAQQLGRSRHVCRKAGHGIGALWKEPRGGTLQPLRQKAALEADLPPCSSSTACSPMGPSAVPAQQQRDLSELCPSEAPSWEPPPAPLRMGAAEGMSRP